MLVNRYRLFTVSDHLAAYATPHPSSYLILSSIPTYAQMARARSLSDNHALTSTHKLLRGYLIILRSAAQYHCLAQTNLLTERLDIQY